MAIKQTLRDARRVAAIFDRCPDVWETSVVSRDRSHSANYFAQCERRAKHRGRCLISPREGYDWLRPDDPLRITWRTNRRRKHPDVIGATEAYNARRA